MLNKIDKTFIISAIIFIVSLFVPIIYWCFLFNLEKIIPNIVETRFFIFLVLLFVICYLLFIPISYITQFVTFILKLFSKNKHKKDWIIILINLILILIFSFLILYLIFLGWIL